MWQIFRKKSIDLNKNTKELKPCLTALDLVFLGIGGIIGAGVFVITGVAAATKAGPAVIFSFILAGVAAMFAALAYAELASSLGGCGSAYSYSYIGFGELIAWIVGWNLLLEYAMTLVTVAIGWSGYVTNLLQALSLHLPASVTKNPFQGGIIDLIAVSIVLAITFLLAMGVSHTKRLNNIVVFIKLIAITVFIVIAAFNINLQNWHDFMPFGWHGIIAGASLVFFAYIGFDALSTTVEESINPQKNIPFAIIVSVIICTLIYVVVSGLLTAIVPYQILNVPSPISDALLNIGYPVGAAVVAAGAIAGLTTVIIVMFFGLTRICLAMARDGMLPSFFSHIHHEKKVPTRIIYFSGIIIAPIAGLLPIDKAAELVNIGTLTAFTFVCAGVIYLRKTHQDLHRPFKLPLNPLFPALGIIASIYLMLHLPAVTWWRFVIWSIVGLIIYFSYGQKHSLLQKKE